MRTLTMNLMILALVSLSLGACTDSEKKPPVEKIRLQLKWVHQAQFAGFYLAKEKGFYTKENLDVDFLEGGKGVDVTEALLSGPADFAVVAPEDILIKRSRGATLTAIAAIYRRSAVVFLSKADSGIDRPIDFAGKTIAVAKDPGEVRDFRIQFDALAKKLNLDVSHIRRMPYDPSYKAFLDGSVDVTPAYITGGLIRLKQAGHRLNVIWPGDYEIYFYSDMLAASEQIIQTKPEVVTRFLRASLKGWREAVNDTEAAVTATLKYARIKDESLQKAMMEAQIPLVHTGEDHIGWMTENLWEKMVEILYEEGIIPTKTLDESKVYTMRFLETVYEDSKQ